MTQSHRQELILFSKWGSVAFHLLFLFFSLHLHDLGLLRTFYVEMLAKWFENGTVERNTVLPTGLQSICTKSTQIQLVFFLRQFQ